MKTTRETAVAADLVLKRGRVIDLAGNIDGIMDVAIAGDRIVAVEPSIAVDASARAIDVSGKLVVPGTIDTHAHIYQHVTGKFGLAPDLVGVRSAATTLVDQGGPSCMTIGGFRRLIAEPSESNRAPSLYDGSISLPGPQFADRAGPGWPPRLGNLFYHAAMSQSGARGRSRGKGQGQLTPIVQRPLRRRVRHHHDHKSLARPGRGAPAEGRPGKPGDSRWPEPSVPSVTG